MKPHFAFPASILLAGTACSNEKYLRLNLDADAWYSYPLTLGRGFTEKEGQVSFQAFMDASYGGEFEL